MGKGDKKTRRGKITIGSFGVRRRKKLKDKSVVYKVSSEGSGPKKTKETGSEVKTTQQSKGVKKAPSSKKGAKEKTN